MNHVSIKTFEDGMTVNGNYVVAELIRATTSKGDPYMRLTLQDSTGKFPCNAWFNDDSIAAGQLVSAEIKVQTYNNSLNGSISRGGIKLAGALSQEELAQIIPYTPYDIAKMWDKLEALIASIGDAELKSLVSAMIEDASLLYHSMPAARGVHHDTIGGLLQHTLEMAITADHMAGIYPVVNRDLLVAGTILHDYAKIKEFHLTQLGLCDTYTLEGNLLGHLHMGACMVEEKGKELGISPEKILLLKHMLLSHHGNREWGAVQLPSIPEASMLFYIDMISSRMEIYRKEYDKLEVGERSKDACRVLDGVYVYRHNMAPRNISWELK